MLCPFWRAVYWLSGIDVGDRADVLVSPLRVLQQPAGRWIGAGVPIDLRCGGGAWGRKLPRSADTA
ncbi:hypothetical protein XAB3213_4430001 [Xanthomonas citri pv. bilvae]|nr:hypothetical protein XAB3213_4430001 [Xanthomonas citri pv. bilvae]